MQELISKSVAHYPTYQTRKVWDRRKVRADCMQLRWWWTMEWEERLPGRNIQGQISCDSEIKDINEWTDTSLRYRHWRMCFERLLQAFARWQPGNLFDIAAQPILEYCWIDSYSQQSLQTQFKVATVYSIHTQSLSWCSTGLVPNVLPRRDEGSGKPCAVDRAS